MGRAPLLTVPVVQTSTLVTRPPLPAVAPLVPRSVSLPPAALVVSWVVLARRSKSVLLFDLALWACFDLALWACGADGGPTLPITRGR